MTAERLDQEEARRRDVVPRNLLCQSIGWKCLGKVLCGWVTQPGDIEGKPELKEAFDLGKSI